MRFILFVVLTGIFYNGFSQLQLTEEQNFRGSFYHSGLNRNIDIKKAAINRESAYLLFYNEEKKTMDSSVLYFATYDSMGNVLKSVDFTDDNETVYNSTNTYKEGKLVKRYYTIYRNEIMRSTNIIEYNKLGLEEFLYLFNPGEKEPIVYKKEYDKKARVKSLWEADPYSKRFSLTAQYDYLSNGDLRKISQYPVIHQRYTVPGKVLFFRTTRAKNNITEIISNEQGQELVSYVYDKKGRCFSKRSNWPELLNIGMGASGVNHAGALLNHGLYKFTGGSAATEYYISTVSLDQTNPAFTDNTNEVHRFIVSFRFNDNETVDKVIVTDASGVVRQVINYYYNEKLITNPAK
ncbi:MAG: hypothetical protein H7Y86_17590 [Rhizobacter sp.]|nr:hypothetical protein [Ferruginibacter sp.]